MSERVLIVGAGFSGTLLAINLLRFEGPAAVLVERRGDQVARGVAYSSPHPSQLLNVRAAGMSAFPDDAAHFVRWLAARGGGVAQSFVPRATYGDYLRDALAEVRARRPDRLTLVEGEACDLARKGDGWRLMLADGGAVRGDQVVLATGNLPPHPPGGIDPVAFPAGCYLDDPWRADPASGLGAGDTVVLLGTGLTAIDVALQLDASGFVGTTIALSRRGLRPRAHRDGLPPVEGETDLPPLPLSRTIRSVRARAVTLGWRASVDASRPVTQRLWAASDAATRARFLRHLRPFWDVHRHRLAPAVAGAIDAMVTDGRLRFAAGKVAHVEPDGKGVILHWRARHADAQTATRAARVVNCTGPQGDLTRTTEPLLASLHARGIIRPDALRLGIDVDAQSRVVGRGGAVDEALCCIGPMTRGGLWEVVAVPDLRRQAWDLARRLAHAQWVGGEGL
jgi:uncharacterized NAD(P)/FAD-binding protein YdhS